MALLSFILGFLLQPLVWLLFLIVGMALVRSPRWKNRLAWSAVGIALLFTNPWLHHTLSNAWEPDPVAIEAINNVYDDGIVLGGFTRLSATPLDRLHLNNDPNRFTQAVELYQQGKIKRLIFVSGSYAAADLTLKESEIAVRTAQRFGIPPSKMVGLSSSLNTHENATECRSFFNTEAPSNLNEKKRLLITSAFHARRAKACFEKAGIPVELFPTDHRSGQDYPGKKFSLASIVIPHPATITSWNVLFREWLAIFAYKIRKWV